MQFCLVWVGVGFTGLSTGATVSVFALQLRDCDLKSVMSLLFVASKPKEQSCPSCPCERDRVIPLQSISAPGGAIKMS